MTDLSNVSSPPAKEGSTGAYVTALDGVRAASIILVVATHTAPLGLPAWELNGMAGRMGMALFFCLSGYLITSMLYRDQRILPFLAKRVMRIAPAMALYLAFLVVFFDLPLRTALLNMTFVSNYIVEGLVSRQTSHLWSLCVEMHFYIAISIAVGLGGRRALYLVFPAALIVTGMRVEGGIIANINTHLRVDEILVGAWLALGTIAYGHIFRRWLSDRWVASGAIAVLTVLLMVSSHNEGGALVYMRPYITMLLVGCIMHCNLRGLLAILESGVSRYIAKISYALYIWHPVMVFGWMDQGSTLQRYLLKRPVSWALSWFAAHISTTYWEAIFQRRTRQYLKQKGY